VSGFEAPCVLLMSGPMSWDMRRQRARESKLSLRKRRLERGPSCFRCSRVWRGPDFLTALWGRGRPGLERPGPGARKLCVLGLSARSDSSSVPDTASHRVLKALRRRAAGPNPAATTYPTPCVLGSHISFPRRREPAVLSGFRVPSRKT
jgi:hypothetical protein